MLFFFNFRPCFYQSQPYLLSEDVIFVALSFDTTHTFINISKKKIFSILKQTSEHKLLGDNFRPLYDEPLAGCLFNSSSDSTVASAVVSYMCNYLSISFLIFAHLTKM